MLKKIFITIFLLVFSFGLATNVQAVALESKAWSPEIEPYITKESYDVLKLVFEVITTKNKWNDPNAVSIANENYVCGQENTMSAVCHISFVAKVLGSLPVAGMMPRTAEELIAMEKSVNNVKHAAQTMRPLDDGSIAGSGLNMFRVAFNYPFSHFPASAKQEIKSVAQKMFDPPGALAQGIGFTKLNTSRDGYSVATIIVLWTASRNASLLVIVVLLIAAGFMVMFRSQINPQTVVTVQMILPKLVIALVLTTFSYAIVGFVLDMVYVVIAVVVGLYSYSSIGVGNLVAGGDVAKNIAILWNADSTYIGNVFLGYYLQSTWNTVQNILINTLNLTLWTSLLPSFLTVNSQVNVILFGIDLGLLVWALWGNLKIVYTLYMAYLQLLILTITAPLQIMMDIIPSKESSGFVPWFKCVVGNASVFALTAIVVIVMQVVFNFVDCGSLTIKPPSIFTLSGGTGVSPVNAPACSSGSKPDWVGTYGIEGLFSRGSGFTLPFLGGTDQLAGDITKLGDQNGMSGIFPIKIILNNIVSGAGVFEPLVNTAVISYLNSTSTAIGLLERTGFTFLLVGIINMVPGLITTIKKNLCKGEEINFGEALKPLQDAFAQFTKVGPLKLK
ncbi:hypothetical protein HZB69_04600 [Candidatus Amesbacteria bacterium]|nr:hypothetical protein [Candidatus Amesbacteria bacterium]